jgi:activator of HSP90 ATPase
MSRPIQQEIMLPGHPDRVYEALTKAEVFSAFTGAPARIETGPGGELRCFGGNIEGRQVELIPGKRIVQAWRVSQWDPGIYSIVRFELRGAGEDTSLTLSQDGFPDDARDHLDPGWHKMYWEPLRSFLKTHG